MYKYSFLNSNYCKVVSVYFVFHMIKLKPVVPLCGYVFNLKSFSKHRVHNLLYWNKEIICITFFLNLNKLPIYSRITIWNAWRFCFCTQESLVTPKFNKLKVQMRYTFYKHWGTKNNRKIRCWGSTFLVQHFCCNLF